MKKIFKPLILLFAYFLISNSVIAQKDSTTIVKKNVIYVQIFGLGGASINYDRVFLQKPKYKMAYRVGVESVTFIRKNDNRLVALGELNVLLGKQNHFFETGIGFNTIFPTTRSLFEINIGPNVGYRFQKVESGCFFRVNIYPVGINITKSNQVVVGSWRSFGVSVGRSF